MQLIGKLFSEANANLGKDISVLTNYPAEIRAPAGSPSGVSGFKLQFGKRALTPGDECDVLVAMNPASIKTNLDKLKNGTIIIVDEDYFVQPWIKKAGFETDDVIEEAKLADHKIIYAPITSLTKSSLEGADISKKEMTKSRNMLALGILCWMFDVPVDLIASRLKTKFAKKNPAIAENNIKVVTAGYNYGENTHLQTPAFKVNEAVKPKPGTYKNINGNTASAWGLIAAAEKAGLELFLGSYPITPATEILQELATRRDLGAKAYQAEDEIAGICSSIGAAFAGNLAATSTSGPGMALKSEAIGLAVMAELPLVIINVQRGGPSTGLPTKTEQADLNQALYGRNGDCPVVVLAATSPADCFDKSYEACKIALENMCPVIVLTEGYLANGFEPWRIPSMDELAPINPPIAKKKNSEEEFLPYLRPDGSLVREWAVPGTPELQHRIGGLEKALDGRVSTAPATHNQNVQIRQQKIDHIKVPDLKVEGEQEGDLLIVGWGSTHGFISSAIHNLENEGHKLSYAHFDYINPLPANTGEVLSKFKRVLVCEINNGQFVHYLKSNFSNLEYFQFNNLNAQPFQIVNIEEAIKNHL
jgi:2-oxoglutarate ferredoxin oxidoreductase subunit alpha